jgi:hypothetical protein
LIASLHYYINVYDEDNVCDLWPCAALRSLDKILFSGLKGFLLLSKRRKSLAVHRSHWRRIEAAGKEAAPAIPTPLTSRSLHISPAHWVFQNYSCRWNNLPRILTDFLRKKKKSLQLVCQSSTSVRRNSNVPLA